MNILAIKLRHVGDNLLATPALALLKKHHPSARLTYLVPKEGGGADLFRDLPFVDEVLEFPRDTGGRVRLADRLRRGSFDLSVDFSWDTRSALWGMVSGAPIRLGYLFRKRVPVWPFYTRACRMGRGHTALANLDLVALAGARPAADEDMKLQLRIPDDARARADRLLRESGVSSDQPILILHPTSRWMYKCWTDEGNARFLDGAERALGLRPVVTSGPAAVEMDKVSRILAACRSKPATLAGRTDLLTLAALIARARLFVGVDSAPVHIASAVGTPVVAVFGPSGQKEWHPWRVPYRTIQRLSWSCCPCGQDGCAGTKRSRCLEDISPEEVLSAARNLLDEVAARK
ncbi:MAG: putative lipopolysaccharide heptosyltransferase III [Candidatus Lindowbacteria bacterium RIFCSPLOWO2_12_FULL_62_27]|nr:MAG: putative lipopolysaccharide heptosyltransferase III [Candidatus Lindowbacteria bacterium RIFCSPLOWO2_12_FULL_62_27]